jgi:putative transposase
MRSGGSPFSRTKIRGTVTPIPGSSDNRTRLGAHVKHYPHRGLCMRSPREFIRAQMQPDRCPV